jgi:hypothetical protein
MAFRALVTVGDYDFPEPSAYSANTSTLVDSGRNVQGRMVGSVIRDDVSKIEISWKYLTVQQWARIQQCFRQSAGGKFINLVTFFDQSAGGWVTKEMYVNDRKAGMWRRSPDNGNILGWTDCALSLIEV